LPSGQLASNPYPDGSPRTYVWSRQGRVRALSICRDVVVQNVRDLPWAVDALLDDGLAVRRGRECLWGRSTRVFSRKRVSDFRALVLPSAAFIIHWADRIAWYDEIEFLILGNARPSVKMRLGWVKYSITCQSSLSDDNFHRRITSSPAACVVDAGEVGSVPCPPNSGLADGFPLERYIRVSGGATAPYAAACSYTIKIVAIPGGPFPLTAKSGYFLSRAPPLRRSPPPSPPPAQWQKPIELFMHGFSSRRLVTSWEIPATEAQSVPLRWRRRWLLDRRRGGARPTISSPTFGVVETASRNRHQ